MDNESVNTGKAVPLASPTRSKATWKPRMATPPLPFFRIEGGVALGIDDGGCITRTGDTRCPEIVLPYAFGNSGGSGTGGTVGQIRASDDGNTDERLLGADARMNTLAEEACADAATFSIRMIGGFEGNALEVRWTEHEKATCIRWLVLKTYTGMQVRYIMPDTRQPIVFALAGDDAYAYCDKDPCEDCTFHCKRGFELYAGIEGRGIVTIPVHEPS